VKFFRLLACVSWLCFGSTLPANAQVPGTPALALRASNKKPNSPVREEFTVHYQVEEAEVRFVVTDRSGKPVLGLHPEDVHVFDDNVPVPELNSFALSHKPLEVGVLVDLSDSISSEQKGETLIAVDLLDEIFDVHRDEAFLVGFSNKARVLQPETTDISLIREALLHNLGRQGLTSLFDAVVQTCRTEFSGNDSNGRQKILLLFSDGADTLSIHGPDEAVSEALRAGVTIYAITTSNADTEGFRNLKRLSEQTGGRVYFVPKKRNLDALKVAMNETVRAEYTVSFRPATDTSGFHPVRIELPTRHNITVRASTGYYIGTQ
jgi:VWFA-related protein